MSYGIKISKDCFDAKNADILNMVLDSQYSVFKIKTIDTHTHSWIKYDDTHWYAVYDYIHNLGYIPYAIVWAENVYASQGKYFKVEMSYGEDWWNAGYYIDSTKIRVRDSYSNNEGSPPPFNPKCKILVCHEVLQS